MGVFINYSVTFLNLFLLIYICGQCNAEQNIVSARIESCPGCKLNRLKDVRAFIYDDIPKYENVQWKKIQGASPEVIFVNDADEEVERHQLEKLNRKECNDLLKSKGFKLKEGTNEREL